MSHSPLHHKTLLEALREGDLGVDERLDTDIAALIPCEGCTRILGWLRDRDERRTAHDPKPLLHRLSGPARGAMRQGRPPRAPRAGARAGCSSTTRDEERRPDRSASSARVEVSSSAPHSAAYRLSWDGGEAARDCMSEAGALIGRRGVCC